MSLQPKRKRGRKRSKRGMYQDLLALLEQQAESSTETESESEERRVVRKKKRKGTTDVSPLVRLPTGMQRAYDQQTGVGSVREVIRGDGRYIRQDNVEVHGSHCHVVGDNVRMVGNHNTLVGDNGEMLGNHTEFFGSRTRARGRHTKKLRRKPRAPTDQVSAGLLVPEGTMARDMKRAKMPVMRMGSRAAAQNIQYALGFGK